MNENLIRESIQRTRLVMAAMEADTDLQQQISQAINLIFTCLQNKNKLLFAGNGGSAADCQHMSAEFVSRFMFDRPGLPSIALTTDTSALTAIGNDYGFENIFSRQIQALGKAGDVLIAYSTSGTSANILKALKEAKARDIPSIGMTGTKAQGKAMSQLCDITIRIPSQQTPHIQEGHLVVGHLLCYVVEKKIFGKQAGD